MYLSAVARQEYYLELGNALPPPVNQNRELHERRMRAAVEAFNALNPGNAFEGRLVVQIILCGAHSAECMRQAGLFHDDFAKRKSCLAQAASLQREARATIRILKQEQKQRPADQEMPQDQPARPMVSAVPPAARPDIVALPARAASAPATPTPPQTPEAPDEASHPAAAPTPQPATAAGHDARAAFDAPAGAVTGTLDDRDGRDDADGLEQAA